MGKFEKLITTSLPRISVDIVRSTTDEFSKTFHTTVFALFASSQSVVVSALALTEPKFHYCFVVQDGVQGHWFLDQRGAHAVRQWFLDQVTTSVEPTLTLHAQWQQAWIRYVSHVNELSQANLASLDAEELVDRLERFYADYLEAGGIGYLCDSWMSTGEEDWLIAFIRTLRPELTNDEVHALVTPAERTLSAQAHESLREIGRLLAGGESAESEIQSFIDTFWWLDNNYFASRRVTPDDVRSRALESLNHPNPSTDDGAAREELIVRLNDSSINRLVQLIDLVAGWKDIRKSGVQMGMYFFHRFLEEIAGRLSLTPAELGLFVLPEFRGLVTNGIDRAEISARQTGVLYFVTPEGFSVLSGDDAKPYIEASPAHRTHSIAELKGVTASPGLVTAPVRIVRTLEDMQAFQPGEILVTNQTTPEFVPIMRKAAAIITEQGGITSHAAVISRELGVPCIIGTKIATKVFQTGDQLEVDATNGVVRKIKA